MANLQERLEQAEEIIKQPSFRQNKGLGNEVGYYVFDYPAEQEMVIREWTRYMEAKYSKSYHDFELLVFDLYDIIIDTLEQEDFMEDCFRFEKKKGMERIVESVGRLLQISDDASMIVQHIRERTPQNAVVFLTGVGKCYPLLRSHKVLNNLHQSVDHVPVVMFFPGTYDGQELVLFSEIKDDNYYRAFRLVE